MRVTIIFLSWFGLLAWAGLQPLKGQAYLPMQLLGPGDGLSAVDINSYLFRSRQGLMYISSTAGTNVYNGKEVRVYRQTEATLAKGGYLGVTNQSPFFEARNGDIWFTTDGGINCHEQKSGRFRGYRIGEHLESRRYSAFALEQDRWLWMVYEDEIHRLDTWSPRLIQTSEPVTRHQFNYGAVRKDSIGRVTQILGGFWFLPGILRIDVDPLSARVTQVDTLRVLSNGDTIDGIMEWAGAEDGTLFATSKSAVIVWPSASGVLPYAVPYPHKFRNPIGLSWRRKGELWLLGRNEIVACGTEECRRLSPQETGIPPDQIGQFSLFIDRDRPGHREMIWMNQPGNGIVFANLCGNRIQNLNTSKIEDELGRAKIKAGENDAILVETPKKRLRFIPEAQSYGLEVQEGASLPSLSPLAQKAESLKLSYQKECEAGNQYAMAGMDGKVYIFSTVAQVDGLQPDTLVYETPNLGPVFDVDYDPRRKWVWATSVSGLYAIDAARQKTVHYGKEEGLVADNLRWAEIMANGEIWLGTTKGVTNFQPDNPIHFVHQLTQRHGLSANECKRGEAIKTTSGKIAFVTAKGIDVFHPDSLKQFQLPCMPNFSGLLVHGKPWQGPQTIDRTRAVELPHYQNALELTFADQEYGDPLPSRYRILLQVDGEQIDTNELGTNNSFVLPNLPPAEYRFGLMAHTASDPNWSPPRWLTINITPHWTQTAWFRSLLLAFGLAIIGMIVAARYRYQLRVAEAQAARERLAAQQREAALQRKIDLEEQRRKITSRMHNDMGGNLTTLSMLASRLKQAQNPEKTQEISDKIIHWTRDLRRRISSFLRMMNPQYDTLSQVFGIIRTYSLDLLSEADIQVKIDMPSEFPAGSVSPDFGIGLLEIVQEVLTNIVKYAMANEVAMTLKIEGDRVYLDIIDDGQGFSPTEADYTQGIGLSSIKGLAQQFGGDLKYELHPQGGTHFRCWLVVEKG